MKYETKLSETDKLLKKLDFIIDNVKGVEQSKQLIILGVTGKERRDEFERIRFDLNDRLNRIELLLNDKEKVERENPSDKLTKIKLGTEIDDNIRESERMMGNLFTTLKADKRKAKFLEYKDDAYKLAEERLNLLKVS
jgi:hypothetical protein